MFSPKADSSVLYVTITLKFYHFLRLPNSKANREFTYMYILQIYCWVDNPKSERQKNNRTIKTWSAFQVSGRKFIAITRLVWKISIYFWFQYLHSITRPDVCICLLQITNKVFDSSFPLKVRHIMPIKFAPKRYFIGKNGSSLFLDLRLPEWNITY